MAVSCWTPIVGSQTGGYFAAGSSLTFSGSALTIPDPTLSGILTTEVVLTANASITLPALAPIGGVEKNPEILFIQGPGGPWTPSFVNQNVDWPATFNPSTGWSASVGHYDRVQYFGRYGSNGYGAVVKGLNYTPTNLWSPVGAGGASTSIASAASWTLPYTALAVGDVIAVGIGNFTTKTVSSISSAGAGSVTWALQSPQETSGVVSSALAIGTVATAGSLTITAVMTGAASGNIICQEFVPFSSTPATVDGAAFGTETSATSISLTSGTPAGANELFVAVVYAGNTITTYTSGYTEGPLVSPGNEVGLFWNCNIPATAQTLTVNLSPSAIVAGVGVLLKA